MACPPPLVPGARIRLVAPSSPFEVDLVRRGVAWLAGRYEVSYAPDLFERKSGFLAGSDSTRLGELQEAFDDPSVDAVLTARGGYGLTRIEHDLDWSRFDNAPKWLVGFSDLTALHLEAVRRGHVTLHAHNAAGLGKCDEAARKAWTESLESPHLPRTLRGVGAWSSGAAAGRLFGGNLTLLFTQAAAGRVHPPENCILFLEDVTETSYRIDRMLVALESAGVFARAAAVILGEFTNCSSGKYQVPTDEVLQERLTRLGIPVVYGLPCGHGQNNDPLHLGGQAEVDAANSTVVVRAQSAD